MITLQDQLTAYLAMRRAFGTQLRWPEASLRRFVEFVESKGADFLTIDIALQWVGAFANVKDATRARSLQIVRGFAVWLHATDPRNQVPPHRLIPSRQRRPTPYILRDREISDLVAAAQGLPSATGLRGWTYSTLIGLLASTGLRPGEARRLDGADVDLANGILAVRESKFGKSRFVPLHASSQDALATYARYRDAIASRPRTPAFFLSERKTRLTSSAARHTFAKLGRIAGLRPTSPPRRSGRGPRLQDLRHTFATKRLVEWYRSGSDVERLIPALSTYLGHVRLVDTYWYIQAVPELLRLATERLERNERGGAR